MNLFMLTVSGTLFGALYRHLKYVHHVELSHIGVNPLSSDHFLLVEFNRIVREIECNTDNVNNTIVFIGADLLSYRSSINTSLDDCLDPLKRNGEYPQLVSMLILAFPEIHWIFVPGRYTEDAKGYKMCNDFHCYKINNIEPGSITSLNIFIKNVLGFSNSDLIALFDPGNLRNQIKQRIYNLNNSDEQHGPLRDVCAASIDEEISYALIHGYTAYRFGYRVWVIADSRTMGYVFGDKSEIEKVSLVFEDLYLNFPDKALEVHLSKLEDRDCEKNFPRLKKVDDRILVTVGHKKTDEAKKTWLDNIKYLKSEFNGCSKILFKPLSGIFDLWKKTGKWKLIKNCPKFPDGFVWPLKNIIDNDNEGHSTPGRLLLISGKLLDRSKRILKNSNSVKEAIHAASLALEAKELLACKTPTMSLEALSLQHQAEVEAECLFYGIEYDLDVKSRIKDIRNEVTAISKWFHSSSRKRSQLNAEITIFSALAQRYRKYSQFDEENVCLHENRKLTNTLRASRSAWEWVAWPLKAYINFLLKSLTRFAIVIVLWVFLFGSFYWYIANKIVKVGFIDSVIVSANTFLAFQPPSLNFWVKNSENLDFTPIPLVFFILPAVLGFVHLGVFISHLTMILMRKPGGG